jgi:hypothetical protein
MIAAIFLASYSELCFEAKMWRRIDEVSKGGADLAKNLVTLKLQNGSKVLTARHFILVGRSRKERISASSSIGTSRIKGVVPPRLVSAGIER